MTAFQTDDYYNVIPEHVIEALKLDAKLKDGGTLDVKLWEPELRETSDEYNTNELPAIGVTCDLSTVDEANTGENRRVYAVTIWVITDGGRKANVTQSVKAYAARIERAMMQQTDTSKQLNNVTADLLEAVSGSVIVSTPTTAIGGPVGEALRGAAVLTFGVSIDFTYVID